MAEACAARAVALERPAAGFAGFAGFDGGQTAASIAVKNAWLGRVAARVVASCLGKACGNILNALENRWLKREFLPVLLERHASVGLERPAGPRRRPCLGQGRGWRISPYITINQPFGNGL